jgi:hypothetical protein
VLRLVLQRRRQRGCISTSHAKQIGTAWDAATVPTKVTHLELHNVPQLPDLGFIPLRKRCGPAHIMSQSECLHLGVA